jgi:Tfp pilus assembly protein PilF
MTAADEPTPPLNSHQAADIHLGLGRSLEQRGDLAQAQAAYLEAEKRDPQRAEIQVRLAVVYDRQGKFKESAAHYQKALKLDSANPDIYCDLGYSLYLQRRFTEAETNLKKALSLKADHARAQNNLALVLARTNRVDDALAHFREGGCSASQAHINVAFAMTLDQRWDEARMQYQHALASNPDSEAARKGMQELQQLVARSKSAPAPANEAGGPVHLSDPVDLQAEASLPRTLSQGGHEE